MLAEPTPNPPLRLTTTRSWRVLVALLLGLGVFLGAVTPHGLAAEHRESPLGANIDHSARHPGDPAHFEQSTVEFQPGCPLCVLQLQTVSVLRPLEAFQAPLLIREAVLATVQRVAPMPALRVGPARAPPRLVSSL